VELKGKRRRQIFGSLLPISKRNRPRGIETTFIGEIAGVHVAILLRSYGISINIKRKAVQENLPDPEIKKGKTIWLHPTK
jgi:hypothetical protein